jgi:hypothetical protein
MLKWWSVLMRTGASPGVKVSEDWKAFSLAAAIGDADTVAMLAPVCSVGE